jgi:predicted RNA-binding protein YlxR (DUF448 family)
MARRRDPLRTCVGCRASAPKGELVRLVIDGANGITVDPSGSAPGRGAYLHPEPGCAEGALRSHAIGRSLRVRVNEEEAARLRNEIGRLMR